MTSAASPAALRKLLEDRFSLLATELETFCDAQVEARVKEELDAALTAAKLTAEEARDSVRRELADHLNQSVRRLRQAEGLAEIGSTLADAGRVFCNVAAVFSVSEKEARGVRVRGYNREDGTARFESLHFPVTEAAAFAGALHSQDPVIAMSTPGELSPTVVEFFGHRPEERVCLFPITVREQARAVLYASGSVQMAPLELLAQTASLALEMEEREPVPVDEAERTDLVRILPAAVPVVEEEEKAAPVREARRAWEELPAGEQQAHLRAQRFARVQVAEMRLYRSEAVKAGRSRADLYGQLRQAIDAAREAYREMFLRTTPGMVDYLHVELVRTLANDDEALLGKEYPGPLV
jgi:hypothetical protein